MNGQVFKTAGGTPGPAGGTTVEKVAKLAGDLRARMEGAAEWEKVPTSIPGIFLVHMPGPDLRVMLMFVPTDEAGAPTKRKGFYFGDAGTVEAARAAFADERLGDLVAALSLVNGATRKRAPDEGDVFRV